MIKGITHSPVTYFVTPEEKDAFVADKLSNGCIIGRMNWISERAMFEITVTYIGIDLAD